MPDGRLPASAQNHQQSRASAARGGRGRSGRHVDAGRDAHDSWRSQQQPSVSGRKAEQAAQHSVGPQTSFIPQRIIVLMGLPGSGKTTLATRLRQMGWIWINQDTMGDRSRCEFECKQALLAGREVVIDRCNFDERQRAPWVGIAHQGSHRGGVFVMGLHLGVPVKECIHRAEGRLDHPTLNGKDVVDVILKFDGMFQRVGRYEGFNAIYRAVQQQEIDDFVNFVGKAQSYPPAFNGTPTYHVPGMPFGYQANHVAQPVHPTHIQNQAAAQQSNGVPQQHPGAQQQPAAQQADAMLSPHRSNIVPFKRRGKHSPLGSPTDNNNPGSIEGYFVDEDISQDPRPILLFDLNGTLTSHTAAKRSSGKSLMRPGVFHLRRLQEHFRLGIFTSATQRTVRGVLPLLESAAGPGTPLFPDQSLILHRGHTDKVSADHVEAGGKEWDTVKPLHKWFQHLHRVLLMDDDAYKAVSGEEDNMILIHCWEEEEPEDMHLKCVVDILLAMYQDLSEDVDVREQSSEVSEALKVTVAAKIAEHVFGSGGQGSADGVHPALQKSSGLLHVFEDAHGNAAEVELTVSG